MTDETTNEEEEMDDTESTLGDDVLDEVAGDEDNADDEVEEGFGHIEEKDVKEVSENPEDDEEDESELEDDAEDVDYDSFDDVDDR